MDTVQSSTRDTGTGTVNPIDKVLPMQIDAVVLGSDQNTEIGKSPIAGTVSKIEYVPNGAAVADANNYRTWTLTNKTNAGTVIGTLTTHTVGGASLVAATEADFTLSAVAGATTVAVGDVLEIESAHTANGVADPGGLIRVHFTGTLGQTP